MLLFIVQDVILCVKLEANGLSSVCVSMSGLVCWGGCLCVRLYVSVSGWVLVC